MKLIKILLISFFILIVVLTAAAIIFIKTFDVNRFKPQIIAQANKVLNRNVDFERAKLGISLRYGISLKIINLSISEDPAFGKGEFLAVKDVSCGLNLLDYIFRREINVPGILIDSAHITIIRKKDNTINLQSIAQSAQGITKASAAKPAAVVVTPMLLINSLKATNSTVLYIDQSFEPQLMLEITDLNFLINRFSLTQAFPFSVEAAVLSDKKNIKVEGRLRLDLKANQIIISDLKASTDLSQILLSKIPVALPMTKGAILPASLKGKVDFTLAKLVAGQSGLSALAADAALTNGVLQFKELASEIKDIRGSALITQEKIVLNKFSGRIGQGEIEGSGSIQDYLSGQDYIFEASAKNLNIQELITQDKSPVKAEGVLSSKMRLKGKGFSPQAFSSNLSGDAHILVEKVKLKNLNVLRTVLDKISVIPGLAEKFEASLPERFKNKLTEKDTVLSDIKFPVLIENGQCIVNNATFQADEFMFKGKAQAGFDGAFLLEGAFLIPEDLSKVMVTSVDKLQYLLNESQQIYIPLKVSGRGADFKFSVDAEYIAKKIIIDEAQKQIYKILDKAIGTKAEEAQAAPQDIIRQAPATEEKNPTEKAIKDLLEGIFR